MENGQSIGELGSPTRNYGIELLRLVLTYMVCMLHTLGQGGVLSACPEGTVGYRAFWLIEIFSYCAVDGFALISGYTAKNRPLRFSRVVELWFQAFFYSFVVTVLLSPVSSGVSLTASDLMKDAMPVTYDRFWYFTAYFALFLAIPILNQFLFSIDEKTAKKTLLLAIALYSVIGCIADSLQTRAGYSALWLMVLYCIGALMKRVKLFEEKRSVTLLAIWAASTLLTWADCLRGRWRLISYISPTILLNGIVMVVLFSRVKLTGTIVSRLAPLTFGIYLFQVNRIVWINFLGGIAWTAVTKSIYSGVAYVAVVALAVMVIGGVVEFVRAQLFRLLRISSISGKIAALADWLLIRLSALLK